MLNLSECFAKSLNFTTECAKTGGIPRPAALDDLVGSSSAFCVCVLYICTVHSHKCLEMSPTGTNPPYNALFYYFLLA